MPYDPRCLRDFIEISLKPKVRKDRLIKDLYLMKGLTQSEIAKRVGLSEEGVRYHLRSLRRNGDQTVKEEFEKHRRIHNTPYGYQLLNGQLVISKEELKLCRTIVLLVDRKGLNHYQVAKYLSKKGIANRAGNINWNSSSILNIYKRWKNKI